MNRFLVKTSVIIILIETIVIIVLLAQLLAKPTPVDGEINIDVHHIDIPAFEIDKNDDLFYLRSSISLDSSFYSHLVETNIHEEILTKYNCTYSVVIYFGSSNPTTLTDNLHSIIWDIDLQENYHELEFELGYNSLPEEVRESFDQVITNEKDYEYIKILIYDKDNQLIYTLNTYIEDTE